MYYERAKRNAEMLIKEIFGDTDIQTLSDKQKAKKVFIELGKKLHYVETLKESSEGRTIIDDINEVLEAKNGRCNRFAAAYKFLMSIIGVPCKLMVNQNHAYNQVFYEGKWRSCDITQFNAMLKLVEGTITFYENCDLLPFFDMNFRELQSTLYHGAKEYGDEQFEIALQEKDGIEGAICHLGGVDLRVFKNIVSIEGYQDIEEAIKRTERWIKSGVDPTTVFGKDVKIVIDEISYFLYSDAAGERKTSLTSEELQNLQGRTRNLDDRVEKIRKDIALRKFVNSPGWKDLEDYMKDNQPKDYTRIVLGGKKVEKPIDERKARRGEPAILSIKLINGGTMR